MRARPGFLPEAIRGFHVDARGQAWFELANGDYNSVDEVSAARLLAFTRAEAHRGLVRRIWWPLFIRMKLLAWYERCVRSIALRLPGR